MPSREFELRIQDILSEITVVEEIVAGLNFETFTRNRQASRAVLYSLAVIGEAVASAIADLETTDPTLPWHQIRGMRNAVIHEYFRVDLAVIWETIQSDLPILKASLKQILNNI